MLNRAYHLRSCRACVRAGSLHHYGYRRVNFIALLRLLAARPFAATRLLRAYPRADCRPHQMRSTEVSQRPSCTAPVRLLIPWSCAASRSPRARAPADRSARWCSKHSNKAVPTICRPLRPCATTRLPCTWRAAGRPRPIDKSSAIRTASRRQPLAKARRRGEHGLPWLPHARRSDAPEPQTHTPPSACHLQAACVPVSSAPCARRHHLYGSRRAAALRSACTPLLKRMRQVLSNHQRWLSRAN